MAKEDVNIKVSANVAEAIQMWKAMEAGPDGMAKALSAMGEKGKRSTDEATKALEGMAGKWLSVAAAADFARTQMDRYYQTKRQREEESASTAANADKAVREYYTRQRIGDPAEQQKALKGIAAQAQIRTSPLSAAGDAATMLAQFGFSRKEAEGNSLGELLTLQDSISGAGGDSKTVSRKVLEILQRSGRPQTGQSIRELGITVNRLTGRAAGFDADMMSEYAGMASFATQGGASESEGLSIWAALRETNEGKRAKLLFKDYMKRGTQAGEREIRARASQLMGPGGTAESDYQSAADIASSSIQSRVDESENANTMAMMDQDSIPRDEALKRLRSIWKTYGVPETGMHGQIARENVWKHPGFTVPILGWSTDSMYSTKDLAKQQAEYLAPGIGFSTQHRENTEAIQRQIMGQAPLPTQPIGAAPKVEVNVNVSTRDNHDLTAEPEVTHINDLNPWQREMQRQLGWN